MSDASSTMEGFVSRNEAPSAPAATTAAASQPLKGFVMEQQTRDARKPLSNAAAAAGSALFPAAAVAVPLIVLLVVWRRRHRRR